MGVTRVYKPTNITDNYITIVNGDYFMVYKPTFTSLGGPMNGTVVL